MQILGLSVVPWPLMIENWWNKVLLSLVAVGLFFGIGHALWSMVIRARRWLEIKRAARSRQKLLRTTSTYLNRLPTVVASTCANSEKQQQQELRRHGSFGVFLGSFEDPSTSARDELLSRWDALIVDPFQAGFSQAAVRRDHASATTLIARLNISTLAGVKTGSDQKTILATLAAIVRSFSSEPFQFEAEGEVTSPYRAVLLANWRGHLPTLVLNLLFRYLVRLGLAVYIELSQPDFLSVEECAEIDMDLVRGLVCRNGTMLPDGTWRDYYQMKDLQRTVRALRKVSYKGNLDLMIWETLEDETRFDYAVVRRSAKWCRFNCALSWIGTQAALVDRRAAVTECLDKEPLGALAWLKSRASTNAMTSWREQQRRAPASGPVVTPAVPYALLESFLPGVGGSLADDPIAVAIPAVALDVAPSESQVFSAPISIRSTAVPDPVNYSSQSISYTGLGCFPIGIEVTKDSFDDLLEGQCRLRKLKLLKRMATEEMRSMGVQLRSACQRGRPRQADEQPDALERSFLDLVHLLETAQGDDRDGLRIYVGLDSGFRQGSDEQFWGLYDAEIGSSNLDIYISSKCTDRLSSVLHTFLSSRNISRAECFAAESRCLVASDANEADDRVRRLSPRLRQDVGSLSPSELLRLLSRTGNAGQEGDGADLTSSIREECQYQLLDVPQSLQRSEAMSYGYLRGNLSDQDIIRMRIDWFTETGVDHGVREALALALFRQVGSELPIILLKRRAEFLSALDTIVETISCQYRIEPKADIFLLAVLCAFRKLAIEEICLEILDRNPLPNRHPDQAAVFAEMYALGAQCEKVFGMSSNKLGEILAERSRRHYALNPPPSKWEDDFTDLPTSYASTQVDLDPRPRRPRTPITYRISFLGVFAFPALVDILLLTVTGRGLYLTTYMKPEEKTMATAALMSALLLCGAIGTWIGAGGSYYLHSMAFPVANMFVVTRLVAGIAVMLGVGTIAFAAIGVMKGFYSGLIFFIYFLILSTYFNLLAVLSLYQFPGFTFQSGRKVIVACLPILVISPIVTVWCAQDIVVYLGVLFAFVSALLYGSRKIISLWSNWYLRIPLVTEAEVVEWYLQLPESSQVKEHLADTVDLSATPFPRQALLAAIVKEQNRGWWSRSKVDELVRRLSDGYEATLFLMQWYCSSTRTAMPYPYSSTWNLQCKAATDTLKEMQRGLKLHNAFAHWRHGSDDVWCGFLYFIIALMDKWVALIAGGSFVGFSDVESSTFRLAVGFGLPYYLMAAICLDVIAQPLWLKAGQSVNLPIDSLLGLELSVLADARARRSLYWRNLVRFLMLHVWSVALAASLMWTFEKSQHGTQMFLAYIGAYTGLLYFQYNRIFCGVRVLADLVPAAILGLVVGPMLVRFLPSFAYSTVVSLAVATWTAALLSLRTADIGLPRISKRLPKEDALNTKPPANSVTGLQGLRDFGSNLSLSGRSPLQSAWSEDVIDPAADRSIQLALLGIDSDTEWDALPHRIKKLLLRRLQGEISRLDTEEVEWIRKRSRFSDISAVKQYVKLCDQALADLLIARIESSENQKTPRQTVPASALSESHDALAFSFPNASRGRITFITRALVCIYEALGWTVKILVVCLVADPELQRELDYITRSKHIVLRGFIKTVACGLWLYCKTLQRLILPFFMLYGRERFTTLYHDVRGVKTTLYRRKVVIRGLGGVTTGFIKTLPDGNLEMSLYNGDHKAEPSTDLHPQAINTYTQDLLLIRREEFIDGALANVFAYQHDLRSTTKIPTLRECLKGAQDGRIEKYDQQGHVVEGSFVSGGNPVRFELTYRKHLKFADELLSGVFELPHCRIEVWWSMPAASRAGQPGERIPYTRVTEARFTQSDNVYHALWNYDHTSHPTIATRLNGIPCATPAMIQHDWFKVLGKPKQSDFGFDDPIYKFRSLDTNRFLSAMGLNSVWYRLSTARVRTHLWETWRSAQELDAVTVRWLDELALRSESTLRPYWRARDTCRLGSATTYLEQHADTIMARSDVAPETNAWSCITFKLSDLFNFGQGGDTRINTRTEKTQLQHSGDVMSVLAMDTGTWPNEGGGVSACRRDLVNELETIRWHIIAESANDYGVPKFQTKKNVHSLTVLPLWGLDWLTPVHGIFADSLDSAVQRRSQKTSSWDIETVFLPILTTLVRCARTVKFDHQHVRDATQALIALSEYFERDRHWSKTWSSKIVRQRWRELWLSEGDKNLISISEWLGAEYPTIAHMDSALDMWHRYLFIFSIPIPTAIPDVYQASNHRASASYGIVCKIKRGCSLHIWDHAISWREDNVCMSSAMSFDSPFLCTSLLSLSRMTATLTLHHADVVLPCADFFNPVWETEIGTQYGTLTNRKKFLRKIDPVVNGICNMDRFKPVETIITEKPTAVMLSHVRFLKDIKTAILAADVIVNEWGFQDYRLNIYGDMDKAPAYSVECKEILASKGLRDHVFLKGMGNPAEALKEAWIFLNSSISEGLPLAMGEAALAGVPIVCTDVGASFRVVTDAQGTEPFSAIVGPNDVYALARAQINLLALLDGFGQDNGDPGDVKPTMPYEPTSADVERVTERMYRGKTERRRLGFLGRKNVLESFSGDRYLREHEQMLWIGTHSSASYSARIKAFSRTGSQDTCSSREKSDSSPAASHSYLPHLLSSGRNDSWLSAKEENSQNGAMP